HSQNSASCPKSWRVRRALVRACRVRYSLAQCQDCFPTGQEQAVAAAAGKKLHTGVGLPLVGLEAKRQFAERLNQRRSALLRLCCGNKKEEPKDNTADAKTPSEEIIEFHELRSPKQSQNSPAQNLRKHSPSLVSQRRNSFLEETTRVFPIA